MIPDSDPVLFNAFQFAIASIQSESDPENMTDTGNHAEHYFERNPEDVETLFRILGNYRESLRATVRNVSA